jgi:hypothetical protein
MLPIPQIKSFTAYWTTHDAEQLDQNNKADALNACLERRADDGTGSAGAL